ncbi:hypothetical protein FRC03_007619 [Tulasnella sp. 419]|nr:hypothetical protein FRC03_007619 [Tulasnella sp. 419]
MPPEHLPNTPVSIEPVYKDDLGNRVQNLYDIKPDITHIYQPPHDPSKNLRERLARITLERGDLASITVQGLLENPTPSADKEQSVTVPSQNEADNSSDEPSNKKQFTSTDLINMRHEITHMLRSSANDMVGAIELVDLLFSSADPDHPVNDLFSPGSLGTSSAIATSPSRPFSLPSVQALTSQVVVGTKDQTLRRAADVFQAAAHRTAAIAQKGDSYWKDAVRLRTGNWPLVPAPLRESLMGQVLTKGTDTTAKDFWVSYGLEQAPPQLRRQAIAFLGDEPSLLSSSNATVKPQDNAPKGSGRLVFPGRAKPQRLRVGLTTTDVTGKQLWGANEIDHRSTSDLSDAPRSDFPLYEALARAQYDIIEQELYRELLNEAAGLPTAAARASEKMIVIDAARDAVLTFEMVEVDEHDNPLDDKLDEDGAPTRGEPNARNSALASLIYHSLIMLMLRSHRIKHQYQSQKTSPFGAFPLSKPTPGSQQPAAAVGTAGALPPFVPPPILAPVISLLQYTSFINRLKHMFNNLKRECARVGMECEVDMTSVGDDIKDVLSKAELVQPSDKDVALETGIAGSRSAAGAAITGKTGKTGVQEREELLKVGGEAILRIGGRHTIRFTFTSPALLTLHLPLATISITDEDQLNHFLTAEVCKCILERLKDVLRLGHIGATGSTTDVHMKDSASSEATKESQPMQKESSVSSKKSGGPEGLEHTGWLVDGLEGTLVGDWNGGRLQLKVMLGEQFKVTAVAIKSGRDQNVPRKILRYPLPLDEAEADGTGNKRQKGPDHLAHEISLENWLMGILP